MTIQRVNVSTEGVLREWLKDIKQSGGFTDTKDNPVNFWTWTEKKEVGTTPEEVSVALTELIRKGDVRVVVDDIGGTWFELVR